MPRHAYPQNATLAELPGAAGGTVILGTRMIHWGLQLKPNLVVESKDGTYELVRAGSGHPVIDAFQTACDRSQRTRLATRREQRAWTRAAEWAAGQGTDGPEVPTPEYTPDELKLIAKYPVALIPGSLRGADNDVCPGKRVCTVTCPSCRATRCIATSDLFQSRGGSCKACIKRAACETRRRRTAGTV